MWCGSCYNSTDAPSEQISEHHKHAPRCLLALRARTCSARGCTAWQNHCGTEGSAYSDAAPGTTDICNAQHEWLTAKCRSITCRGLIACAALWSATRFTLSLFQPMRIIIAVREGTASVELYPQKTQRHMVASSFSEAPHSAASRAPTRRPLPTQQPGLGSRHSPPRPTLPSSHSLHGPSDG